MTSRVMLGFALVLAAVPVLRAADKFWIGTGGNWSAAANWSLTSGGSGGAVLPTTSDRAVFDALSGDCTVNQNVDCGGWLLTNYTGTITVGDAFTTQVRTSFAQYSGMIVCGTNLFTFYNHSPNFAGGTFTPNASGRVRFQNAAITGGYTINGTPPAFENVSFYTSGGGGTYPWSIPAGSTVTVNRAVVFEGIGGSFNSLNTGTLVVKGSVTNHNGIQSASSTIILSGTGDQTLHGNNAYLPHLVIDKQSGVLTLSGTNKTSRNWTHLAGDINPGVSTAILNPNGTYGSGITSTTGRATFHNLSFDQIVGGGANYYYDLRGGMTLVVSNTLSFGLANLDRGGTLSNGTIEALGDINVNTIYGGSTTLLKIKGSGNQTMQGFQRPGINAIPPAVVIDKPSGTLTLAGTFSLANKWTHLAGNVDPGTSYVWMFAYNNARTALTSAVGRVNFYDVRMDQVEGGGANRYIDLAADTTLVVSNLLMFDLPWNAGAGFQVRNSRVEVHGNVTNECDSVGGTTLLRLTGSGDHSISTFSPFTQLALDMEVDKAGGVFSLASPLVFNTANKDFTVKSGTFNLSTNKFTLASSGTDFRMTSSSATLMTTVSAATNGMIAVTNSGIARIDGNLFVNVAADYAAPDPTRTNTIISAGSGGLVQNTPFLQKLADKYTYDTLDNVGGNRVQITNLRRSGLGTVFMFQ